MVALVKIDIGAPFVGCYLLSEVLKGAVVSVGLLWIVQRWLAVESKGIIYKRLNQRIRGEARILLA